MPPGNVVSWGRTIAAHVKTGRNEEALRCLREMAYAGLQPDKLACTTLLKACANTSHLVHGKIIHAFSAHMGFHSELVVSNSLINMYSKCGALQDAHHILTTMPAHNVVSWTTLIVVYAHHNLVYDALHLFSDMCRFGIEPNRITVTTIINILNSGCHLIDGMCIHALVVEEGLDSELIIGNCIITMYNKCGSLSDAEGMHRIMTPRNVVSWNTMIAAYAQQGHAIDSLYFLVSMKSDGTQPDKISFVSFFKGCVNSCNMREGMMGHAYMVEVLFQSEDVCISLVEMYGKCGRVEDASAMFGRLSSPGVVPWTSIITSYASCNLFEEALRMVQQMLQECVKLDKVVFVQILEACKNSTDHVFGKLTHGLIIDNAFDQDVVVGTALICMYGKCGCMEDARAVFAKSMIRNVFSWSAMIQVCTHHGNWKDALLHFRGMQEDGVQPNRISFLNILDACESPLTLEDGRLIHTFIVMNHMESDNGIDNSLVSMYHKCGSVEDSISIFARMCHPDAVSWTSILCACAEHGQSEQAFELCGQMVHGVNMDKVCFMSLFELCGKFAALELGRAMHANAIECLLECDIDVRICLVNMYNKCGSLEDCAAVFEMLPDKNLFLWSSLIAAFSQHGMGEQVIGLFQWMRDKKMRPDDVTFVSVLSACSHTAMVNECVVCLDLMSREYGIIPNEEHYMCAVDLLGRLGFLTEARFLTSWIPYQPTAPLWLAFLGACRVHNDEVRGKEAAKHMSELDSSHSAAYILLSNIHAAAFHWTSLTL